MDKIKLIMMAIFLAAFLFNTGMTTATDSDVEDVDSESNKMQTGDDVKSHTYNFNTSRYVNSFPYTLAMISPMDSDKAYTRILTHADLNGDGIQDIVVTKHGVNHLYKGEGKGVFTAYKIHDNSKNTNSVSVVDVNGDGIKDIITGNGDAVNYWYENDGNGQFTAHEIHSNAKKTYSITTADVNNDGNLDVVTGNLEDKNYYYESNSEDEFIAHEIHSQTKHTIGVFVVDYNDDKNLDIVTINPESVQIFKSDGNNNFNKLSEIQSETINLKELRRISREFEKDKRSDDSYRVDPAHNMYPVQVMNNWYCKLVSLLTKIEERPLSAIIRNL